MQGGVHHESSLKEKLKSSMCCFMGKVQESLDNNNNMLNINTPMSKTPKSSSSSPATSPGSTSRWLRRHNSNNNNHHHHHRQSLSADFSYDPSSYALNFEDDSGELPLRNFSARLPPSPPRRPTTTTSMAPCH
ncbi:hypothetical protein HN51_046151 [Arachis hypogaea]|uniref:uncharacterized protein LOC107626531 n=1 Tax=Arachis ipaensis TaxID=130454 RepID=UPI0007AF4C3C|nr:uncharacterized protein LOC107626531 [Arachis ipaensis]XP_025635209.1 uncharacterized protein LOC112729048 [Arachis hypogaea]QHO22210.1 uncharacterized protein DS421_12g353160 [Arachis hypogaea]